MQYSNLNLINSSTYNQDNALTLMRTLTPSESNSENRVPTKIITMFKERVIFK